MKIIKIDTNCDLNEIIKSLNAQQRGIDLNEEHLSFDENIYNKLPAPLDWLKNITSPVKRDIALLTILAQLGAILENFEVFYNDA